MLEQQKRDFDQQRQDAERQKQEFEVQLKEIRDAYMEQLHMMKQDKV
jgi:hypothetical protein